MSSKHLPIAPWFDDETFDRCRAFDAWDAAHRRRDRFAGLGIFPKITRSTIYLGWRHWPHLLCWQWILSWEWSGYNRRFFHFQKSGPGATGGLSWTLRLFWIGYLSYRRQASDRISALGPRWADAPVIFPRQDQTQ